MTAVTKCNTFFQPDKWIPVLWNIPYKVHITRLPPMGGTGSIPSLWSINTTYRTIRNNTAAYWYPLYHQVLGMTLKCFHIFIVTGSFLYWCVMRPASQRFFIHSCIYLRIIMFYLATFLGLSVLICRNAVNQSTIILQLIHTFILYNINRYHKHERNLIPLFNKRQRKIKVNEFSCVN